MGVCKNSDTPNWMVYNGNPIKMDDLGGKPTIFGNIHITIRHLIFSFHRGPTVELLCCNTPPCGSQTGDVLPVLLGRTQATRGDGEGEGESAAKDTIPMFDPKRYIYI